MRNIDLLRLSRIDASLKYPSIDKWKTCQKEEVRKILWDTGIEINTKNNLSQVGGIKPLLEILKREIL